MRLVTGNLVLQAELALLQAAQFEVIGGRIVGHLDNGVIQVAVLLDQLPEVLSNVRLVHGHD